MIKKRIFLYPMIPLNKRGSNNPYIDNLCESLNSNFHIINKDEFSKYGILDLYINIKNSDIFYLNWIEDICFKRFGKLQSIFALIFIFLLKIIKKKIVWTMHNKSSHLYSSIYYKLIFNTLCKKSDIIVCHAKDSITKISKINSNIKCFYFFHPFPNNLPENELNCPKDIDILIWGTINQYKGVFEFFNETRNELGSLKIFVIGYFPDLSYYKKLKEFESLSINIENRFVTDEELRSLHYRSKYVLFPYIGDSVLNSGALVNSLTFNASIIGPYKGAFKDLSDLNLILTFKKYRDIITYATNNVLPTKSDNAKNLFCKNNSWQLFGEKLYEYI